MFNETDTTNSSDGQHRATFISSEKITDSIVNMASKPNSRWHQAVANIKSSKLGTKATIIAIAIGTLPSLGIGAIAYNLVSQSVTRQIIQSQQGKAIGLADKVNRFIGERYQDVQVISNLPFLTNTKINTAMTPEEKQAILDQIIEAKNAYNSIAIFDVEGTIIAQSINTYLDDQKEDTSFQKALQDNVTVISKPEKAKNSNLDTIYITAPVKDTVTGKTIAVVSARMPLKSLNEVIKNYAANGDKYSLLDSSGKVFLSSQTELLGQDGKAQYPGLAKLLNGKQVDTFSTIQKINRQQQLVSYVPARKIEALPNLNWKILLTTDTNIAFAPLRQLLWIIAIGTTITAVIVGAIAARLAKHTIQPILNANTALAKLSQGEINTRLDVERSDELGVLNQNINQVATQLQNLHKQRISGVQISDAELQEQLLALLSDVEGAANGDLTVRADVTAGEIGTVADFFNSIIESLRDIVTKVKQAASQVNEAVGSNEEAIRQLAEAALTQTAEIDRTLNAVDQMAYSMKIVAESAQQAATVVNNAAHTTAKSGEAMDLTVHNILALRETVGDTAMKVKRLGESSQQISHVVSLINQIATQTNLLAINAGIEAARAGEEGEGFAVVAEEIGELAIRSAAATQEIEQIVANIQRETSEVVQAMEIGTTQVVEGTRIVEDAKQNLSQILDVSRQIDSLVNSIFTATVSQVQTSQIVSDLMKDIAAISQRTSDSSLQVSQSLQQTVKISHQLQAAVETFKVN